MSRNQTFSIGAVDFAAFGMCASQLAAQSSNHSLTRSGTVHPTAGRSARTEQPQVSAAEIEKLRKVVADEQLQDQQRFDTLRTENQQLAEQLRKTQADLAVAEAEIGHITDGPPLQVFALQAEVAAIKAGQSTLVVATKQQQTVQAQKDSAPVPAP